MGKNKSKYMKRILNENRGVNHMPINGERFTKFESVKNTTREKVVENIEPIIPIVQKTRQEIVETNDQTPECAVDFVSKTFGQIRLREIRDVRFTANDIKSFFLHLDFVDRVTILVDNPERPYIDDTSLFRISLYPEGYDISAHLFWKCLPFAVREKFKKFKNHFVIFQELFDNYNRKISIGKRISLQKN
jgi:hypothetical protein